MPTATEAAATQWVRGDQNVQIHDVTGSFIQISYGGQRREVPLEPAVVPVGKRVNSPARLIRARSGVVPYIIRGDMLDRLLTWVTAGDAFGGCVIGGRGGTGKTRLGVELCIQAQQRGWLCGLLSRRADQAALESLARAPAPRLVVVDYAETRGEQLEVILPTMKAYASAEHPVRVLLLVRAAPRQGDDCAEVLYLRSQVLDSYLDDMDRYALEEAPLEPAERRTLFGAAVAAFAARAEPVIAAAPAVPDTLADPVFANPLSVVIAAYLAVHAEPGLPKRPADLFDELVAHEDHYWQASAGDLDSDKTLRQRVVALVSLTGAASESEAAELLRLLPDLEDATAERRGRLARWAHDLYPGPRWWNPLEPDRVGEHLVATCFAKYPQVLSGVLDQRAPQAIVPPLDLYTRAAPDHPALARALREILSEKLGSLCSQAANQAAAETDLDRVSGEMTLATALDQVVTAIPVGPEPLWDVLSQFPRDRDLILNPLVVTLITQMIGYLRELAAAEPGIHEPTLAFWLSQLSDPLAQVGRLTEGLAASEEAVAAYRRLAAGNSSFGSGLAEALSMLSLRLADVGRNQDALAAIEEAISIYSHLGVTLAVIRGPLNTLALRLGDAGRTEEALGAIAEAANVCRQVVAAASPVAGSPAADDAVLASVLNNQCNLLAKAGRASEALAAIEEATAMYRRLAAARPAAHEPHLSNTLSNLSRQLGQAGRLDEALATCEEAVQVRQRLAAVVPALYQAQLASTLDDLANLLDRAGRFGEACAALEKAVAINRRLPDADPGARDSGLAFALSKLSGTLAKDGRMADGLTACEESVSIFRRLAAANQAAHEPELAVELNNLATRLDEVRQWDRCLVFIEESVAIFRRLAAADSAHAPRLAGLLNNLSVRLVRAGRLTQSVAAIDESVTMYRGLAAADPACEPGLAASLSNFSLRLTDVGRAEESLAAIDEAIGIRRRLAVTDPAAQEPALAGDLAIRCDRLQEAGRAEEARSAIAESVTLRRRLTAANPAAHTLHPASEATNLRLRLSGTGGADPQLAEIEQAVKSADPRAVALAQAGLGGLLVNAGDMAGARPLLEAVAGSADPKAASLARVNLGVLLLVAGDPDRAKPLLEAAIDSADPEVVPLAQGNLGALLLSTGDPDGAKPLLEAAIDSADPQIVPRAQAALGALLLSTGDPDGAKPLLEAAIDSADPRVVPMAQTQLGVLLAEAGDIGAARRLLETAVASASPQVLPLAQAYLGAVTMEAGDAAEARPLLEAAARSADPQAAGMARDLLEESKPPADEA
jgi:tetratricopeptide (TPR) repeat protein